MTHGWKAFRRAVATLLLMSLTGCMTVRPIPAPRQFVESRRPSRIWLTTGADGRMIVNAPRIYLDSIYGYDAAGEQVWVALGDVTKAEARRTSASRTTLLLAGIGTVVVVGAIALNGAGNSRQPEPIDVGDLSRRLP